MSELYIQASKILEKILEKRGSAKGLTYSNDKISNKKASYALVCETLKCKWNSDYFLGCYEGNDN